MKKLSLKTYFKNASLLTKIQGLLIGITLVVVIAVLLTVSIVYSRYNGSRMESQIGTETDNASFTLTNELTILERRFIDIIGTEEFLGEVQPIISENSWYRISSGYFQNYLSELDSATYLVSNSLIVSPDQSRIFYTLKNSPRTPLSEFFEEGELSDIRGITLLSSRSNPFATNSNVIPVVFPIRLVGSYLQINTTDEPSDFYVVLLLGESIVNNDLKLIGNQNDIEYYSLLSSDGTVLTSYVPEDSILQLAQEVISNTSEFGEQNIYHMSGRFIAVRRVTFENMYLVAISPEASVSSVLQGFLQPVINITLIIILVTILLSILVTNLVTRPMKKLLQVVNQIETGSYRERVTFNSNDEVGQLMSAINGMYDTIQTQMVQIREEESSKYKTELKLLTEQINPHFLYNTLEEIQAEVIRGDAQAAVSMIQYLAEYLRIGLSGGRDLIPISSEIQHAQAYVSIMNQRFGQKILFLYRVAPELSSHLVLKTILQPLIENSVRHGFGIDASDPTALTPSIEVEFASPQTNILTIRVSDNGSGFDEAQVMKVMTKDSEDARHHVGIHNVYQRLITFYGKDNVTVTVESMPYYQNTIAFTIHEGQTLE
ncbi:MAG: sensor histidine kinase [Lachnospiraceae bacterium]|jgi:two-component system sensor histidine kinase YesM